MIGRNLFDAFPDNPDAPTTTDRSGVTRSFENALERGRQETLSLIRYDIQGPNGVWREGYWRTVARPIHDDDGLTIALDIEAADLTRHMGELAVWRRRQRG
jgi:hypothetical protein